MWRKPVSKFKNCEIVAEKPLLKELRSLDIESHIAVSADYLACESRLGGNSSLSIYLQNQLLDGSIHSVSVAGSVKDIEFSPCDDSLLAYSTSENQVVATRLQDGDFSHQIVHEKTAETVRHLSWNPLVERLLAFDKGKQVELYDLERKGSVRDFSSEVLHSLKWKSDASLLVVCNEKMEIWDPRASAIAMEGAVHLSDKPFCALFLGNTDYVLSSGFSVSRQREFIVKDVRNISENIASMSIDSEPNRLVPVYDSDTNMLFTAGSGDEVVRFFEFSPTEPFLAARSTARCEKISDVTLLPKRSLDVMRGEVNRLLMLTSGGVQPVRLIAPRKSYDVFHADLFPDCRTGLPSMTAAAWLEGANTPPKLMSLNPADRKKVEAKIEKEAGSFEEPNVSSNTVTETQPHSFKLRAHHSLFRHLKGTVQHRSLHFENVPNICMTIPGESDLFHVNSERVALPLSGAGGEIAIIELSKRGRVSNHPIPIVRNVSNVMDFAWDPFDDRKLVTGCEDGSIRVWSMPEKNTNLCESEPSQILTRHKQKITLVCFHPLAAHVILSASSDSEVIIWNLEQGEPVVTLEGHNDMIFACDWHPLGAQCATFCKDGKIRIFEPRKQVEALKTIEGPVGKRGGRLKFVCSGKYLACTGFDKTSARIVQLFDCASQSCISNLSFEPSPSILTLNYDEDSSTMFLTGKGDKLVLCYEVAEEAPHLFELASHDSAAPHLAWSFVPKKNVNVRDVEFAKAYVLKQNKIEPVSFTVPRIKTEYFQDDLFCDTKILWEPTIAAAEWFKGENKEPKLFPLCPSNMKPLSSIAVAIQQHPKRHVNSLASYKSESEKKEELLSGWTKKMQFSDKLEQDTFEGCNEDEWDD